MSVWPKGMVNLCWAYGFNGSQRLARCEFARASRSTPPACLPGLADFFDRDGDGEVGIGDLIETKVDGEAEEDIAMKNLRTGQICVRASIRSSKGGSQPFGNGDRRDGRGCIRMGTSPV